MKIFIKDISNIFITLESSKSIFGKIFPEPGIIKELKAFNEKL